MQRRLGRRRQVAGNFHFSLHAQDFHVLSQVFPDRQVSQVLPDRQLCKPRLPCPRLWNRLPCPRLWNRRAGVGARLGRHRQLREFKLSYESWGRHRPLSNSSIASRASVPFITHGRHRPLSKPRRPRRRVALSPLPFRLRDPRPWDKCPLCHCISTPLDSESVGYMPSLLPPRICRSAAGRGIVYIAPLLAAGYSGETRFVPPLRRCPSRRGALRCSCGTVSRGDLSRGDLAHRVDGRPLKRDGLAGRLAGGWGPCRRGRWMGPLPMGPVDGARLAACTPRRCNIRVCGMDQSLSSISWGRRDRGWAAVGSLGHEEQCEIKDTELEKPQNGLHLSLRTPLRAASDTRSSGAGAGIGVWGATLAEQGCGAAGSEHEPPRC